MATASVLGGGKFANGAYTGAFQYLISAGVSAVGQSAASRRGEWIYPEGYSKDINDYNEVITNGILGDRNAFVQDVNEYKTAGYFNPSHGVLEDVLESGLQKYFGFSRDSLTAGFADGLKGLK